MGIFLDTSFFMGLCHPDDNFHNNSKKILLEMSTGKFGLIFTSPYIIAEAATLILVRTNNNQELLQKFHTYLYGPKRFARILPWSIQIEELTWALFQVVNKKAKSRKDWMSFVDISNIVYCRQNKIENIASFDRHFDSFLIRIQ